MKRTLHLIRSSPYLIPVLIFWGLIILYSTVIPLEFTTANNGADGGDLLSAILTNGVPHPSGYPSFLLVGKLFQLIPYGTPYFKGALLSAVASALAVSLLAGLVGLSLGERSSSQVASMCTVGIGLGAAPFFWSQAVIVEVYGLQSVFTVCFILWLFLVLRNPVTKKTDMALSALSIIIGLGVGNHLTIFLMFPAMLFAMIVTIRRGFPKTTLLKYCCLMGAAIILVYAYLPLLARPYPPINWGNPQTVEGFIWLVSGQLYQKMLFALPPITYLQRFGYWANLLLKQFGVFGLFFGMLGAVKSFSTPNPIKWIYLWIFATYSIFSIGYLTNDSTVYLIPALIVFSIWIAIAVKELWDGVAPRYALIGKILVVLFFLSLLVRLPSIRQEVDPRQDNSARLFAESAMQNLPPGAIIITDADNDTFPLWYYHFGLGQRPDIRIVVRNRISETWYRQTLAHTYPDLKLPDIIVQNWEKELVNLNPGHRLCTSTVNHANPQEVHYECPSNE